MYLGRRISLRYRLGEPGSSSEAVGVVQAVHAEAEIGRVIEIVKRDGSVVPVPTDRITHLKEL